MSDKKDVESDRSERKQNKAKKMVDRFVGRAESKRREREVSNNAKPKPIEVLRAVRAAFRDVENRLSASIAFQNVEVVDHIDSWSNGTADVVKVGTHNGACAVTLSFEANDTRWDIAAGTLVLGDPRPDFDFVFVAVKDPSTGVFREQYGSFPQKTSEMEGDISDAIYNVFKEAFEAKP